jgi:hypothetical protein
LGNFFLAYGNETMLIIGYGAVGIGGMTAYIATLQILQIFKNQGFVYAFVPSLINCSAFVYMLLKVPGITRKDFFFYYGFVCLGFALVSFLLYPYKAIRAPSDYYSIPVLKLRYFEISVKL